VSLKELGADVPADINKKIEGAKQWVKEINSVVSKLNGFKL